MYKKLYENVEFSFGKGVGSNIYDAINNVTHSVFVLTPYISQGYIDFLLRKKEEGVNVSLMTTTDAQKGKIDEICKKIVVQHRISDEKKMAYKKKAKLWCVLLGLGSIFTAFIGFFWYDLHHKFHSMYKETSRFIHDDSVLLFITLGILLLSYIYYKRFHRIKVFSYFYSTRFPFLVVPSIYSDNMWSIRPMLDSFVHAKVYIVDNKDIYIGSANLTQKGVRHNIESFVKISAPDAVKEIIAEIDDYLKMNCNPIHVDHLGSWLYCEAPY